MALERVTTGVEELDGILQGGIPQYNTVFVAGPPGGGKTILCQQALFANAARAVPTLYLGTLSEPVLKMLRYAQEFPFYIPGMVGRDVIFSDVGDALTTGGGAGLLEEIERLVKRHRPAFLVIDSFKVIREHFSDPAAYRAFISALVLRFAAWEVTSFLVGEYTEADIEEGPEFAVADGIIYLYGMEEPRRQRRFLRVMKMRGTGYFSGEHLFEVTSSGIRVYPRMDPNVGGEYAGPDCRIDSCIPGLREMTAGGIRAASCNLVVGPSGAGKTLCAMSFLAGAAEAGIPGLFVSLEERAEQLIAGVEQFGWGVGGHVASGLIDVVHVPPSELDLDKHGSLIRDLAERMKAGVVMLDTVSALEDAAGESAREYLWAITDYFKRKGVTVLLTYEAAPGRPGIGLEGRLSFLADALIELDAFNVDGTLRRTIQVRKMRASPHDRAVRELTIESEGIRVGGIFAAARGRKAVAGEQW